MRTYILLTNNDYNNYTTKYHIAGNFGEFDESSGIDSPK